VSASQTVFDQRKMASSAHQPKKFVAMADGSDQPLKKGVFADDHAGSTDLGPHKNEAKGGGETEEQNVELGPPSNPLVNALLTDFYQITMNCAYWKVGRQSDHAIFEVFFRKNPFHGEYTIAAGLSEVLRFIAHFGFTDSDIDYIRKQCPSDTQEGFFEYLRNVNSSNISVYALAEGTVVFPRTPVIRIEGPLGVCQLLETTILNLANFPSLIATNAARMRLAAGNDKVLLEFGLRRAQGPDGAMSASRYSYIGGFNATSNVAAGKMFGIDVRGTHAHSFVTAFFGPDQLVDKSFGSCPDFWSLVLRKRKLIKPAHINEGELAAFVAYAQAFPNGFNVLVDTYDTLQSGIPNFIAVALALHELGFQAKGIRLDSGDLASLSKRTREMFTEASAQFGADLSKVAIVASNDINEEVLYELNKSGHNIDVFGIGTNLVTCQAQPALGMVYKLAEINGQAVMKLSNEATKVTIPGRKRVFRLINSVGFAVCDLMIADKEDPPEVGKKVLCRDPYSERDRVYVTPSAVLDLLRPVFGPHMRIAHEPSLKAVRDYVQDQLKLIPDEHRRKDHPTEYKVRISNSLYEYMHDLWLDKVPVPEVE